MITRISPIHSGANRRWQGGGHSSLAILVCRGHVEAIVQPALQSAEDSPQARPPESVHPGRQATIARLRYAIKNGTYNVNAEQIVDKMLVATLIDVLV